MVPPMLMHWRYFSLAIFQYITNSSHAKLLNNPEAKHAIIVVSCNKKNICKTAQQTLNTDTFENSKHTKKNTSRTHAPYTCMACGFTHIPSVLSLIWWEGARSEPPSHTAATTLLASSLVGQNFLCQLPSGRGPQPDGKFHPGQQRVLKRLHILRPGPHLNIKTALSTYGNFHVKDKTAVRTSYL